MKYLIKCICVVLAIVVALSVPVSAEVQEEASTWASSYFIVYSTYLYKISNTQFEVWFDVSACNLMEELGASKILVQRSLDGENWETVQTYTPEDYPQMICEDTGCHAACVTYTGASTAYDYRAYVTFYAKNSSGYAKRYVYAYFL